MGKGWIHEASGDWWRIDPSDYWQGGMGILEEKRRPSTPHRVEKEGIKAGCVSSLPRYRGWVREWTRFQSHCKTNKLTHSLQTSVLRAWDFKSPSKIELVLDWFREFKEHPATQAQLSAFTQYSENIKISEIEKIKKEFESNWSLIMEKNIESGELAGAILNLRDERFMGEQSARVE